MLIKGLKSTLGLIFLCYSLTLSAQHSIQTDSVDTNDIFKWYDRAVAQQNTPLLTGTLYHAKRNAMKSHPFYNTSNFQKGTINYRGHHFKEVDLIYDVYNDELIIRNPSYVELSNEPILLIKDQVSSFVVQGARFEYVEKKIGPYTRSFFEVLHKGNNISLLSKRMKVVKIRDQSTYEHEDKYYLVEQDESSRITSAASIIRRFPERKKEIKVFLKKNRLKIRRTGSDEALKMLVRFCDELS